MSLAAVCSGVLTPAVQDTLWVPTMCVTWARMGFFTSEGSMSYS